MTDLLEAGATLSVMNGWNEWRNCLLCRWISGLRSVWLENLIRNDSMNVT